MNEEQIAKAKEAKSAEELLALAKEYGMEDFTEKDAEDLYTQLHTSGELTDEELESVAGGCSVKVNGNKYTVVTMDTKCQCGQWEDSKDICKAEGQFSGYGLNFYLKRNDSMPTRAIWYRGTLKNGARCGTCFHLGIKNGTGFCEVL